MTPETKMQFIDIPLELTSTEQARRDIVDQHLIRRATNEADFFNAWENTDLSFEDARIKTGLTLLPSQSTPKWLCSLELFHQEQKGLDLSFAAKNTPANSPFTSPLSLYNTKVSITPLTDFHPFAYYDTIMYLIKQASPPDTPLTLYVRQKESRAMLEANHPPQSIPLAQVFRKAQWQYHSYTFMSNATNPLKQHKLVLST